MPNPAALLMTAPRHLPRSAVTASNAQLTRREARHYKAPTQIRSRETLNEKCNPQTTPANLISHGPLSDVTHLLAWTCDDDPGILTPSMA